MLNKIKIYKKYKEMRTNGDSVKEVLDFLKIKRSSLYSTIKEVESGNSKRLKVCMEGSFIKCLWVNKYSRRFKVIPDNRLKESVLLLKKLIQDMSKDGMNDSEISKFIKKDRATVIHHLK